MKQSLRNARLFLALAILTLSACSGGFDPDEPVPTPKNLDELKSSVAAILTKYHVPGVGIALVDKDKVIWAGGVGKADFAANRDVTADTMFRIGSITKGFVALSALQLAEQHKLDLDEKIAAVAPEIPVVNQWDAEDPITLAQLFEHTAGFDDFSLAEFYDFSAPPDHPLLWTLTHFPGPERARWRPGSRTSYSNPGYGLAGYIVEKTAGVPLEDYLAANILRPLGMTHSDMRMTPEVGAALAQGYESGHPVPYHPIYLRPAGEMKSSPNEMARFVRMMLNRGTLDGVRIVSPESITRMETPETSLAARSGLKYGYGLGNYADLSAPLTQHGHDGGIDGFLSRYAYIPDANAGYFFSINASGSSGIATFKLGKLFYQYLAHDKSAPKEPPQQLAPDASDWTGYYEPASPRQQLAKCFEILLGGVFVTIREGAIGAKSLFGKRIALIPTGPNLFRTAKMSAAGTVFTRDPEGRRVMIAIVPPLVPLPVYFVRTNPVWPMTRLALVALALVAMLSTILFAIIWIPRKIFRRMKGVTHLTVRILPLLATVAMLLSFATLTTPPIRLARPGPASITFFLGTIVFAILSLASFVIAIRSFDWPINRTTRIHSTVASIACVGMTLYLGYWGLIGLRTWVPW